MGTLVLAVLFAQWAALAPADPAQKPPAAPPPRLAPWPGKLEPARASAKERNVPIVIHVILEDEQASDEYRDKVLPDREVIQACANVLVIVANNATHGRRAIEVEVDGKKVKREVCASYPVESCAHHQATWDELWREFKADDGNLYCPQTIVLKPDGTVDSRIDTRNAPDPSEVVSAVRAAVKAAGPGLTETELLEVKRLLEVGRNLTESRSWPDAWKTWNRLLAITSKSVYADEALKALPLAQAGVAAELERIGALLAPGTAAEGWRRMSDLLQQCAGLPLEKEIALRLKKAETSKALKDEIARHKLSVEADLLLRQARELTDAGQAKKGEAIVRKLLGKRYADTPAAKSARDLWPEIAADEDARRGGK